MEPNGDDTHAPLRARSGLPTAGETPGDSERIFERYQRILA
jgi:hypothetical protein